ncbi:MAG: Extracellular amino acid transporter substrate-binding protein family [Frankiales bacterium]|nr:Extracellular amino acid transporter substrate-binding protein family [Frankiales bacterium]
MRSLRLSSLALTAALAMTMTACGGDDGDDEVAAPPVDTAPEFAAGSRMAELAEAGKITVGTKFDQPLFGLKGLSGEPEGFDVEIAKIIAGKLGIAEDDITFVESVSANREPFLEQKRVDMVVATYTINDKRDMVVDFAGPYFQAGQDILVAKGNPKGIDGPESLKGKKTCSVAGSTPAETLQTEYGLTTADLQLVDVYTKCRDALANGQVDAVSTDNVILSGYVDAAPDDFELVGKPFTEEPYGIGIPEGQEDFCDFINETLAESVQDGSFEEAFKATAGKVIDTVPTLPAPRGCDK